MSKEINIRQAIPEDAIELAGLARRGMPGYPFESVYDPDALRSELGPENKRIVAVSEGSILGTAVLGDGYMAEIKRVLVDPDNRAKGLGHRLTENLKQKAIASGVVPWADVRADQIGMQKAAYAYDLRLNPISVETGKHVVYSHKNETGPARESMVHMSGLPLAKRNVAFDSEINKWPAPSIKQLVDNMARSLISQDKDRQLVGQILPSASLVKKQIENSVNSSGLLHTQLTGDIIQLTKDGAKCIVITPDASGFVEGDNAESIISLVDKGLDLGLQIITCYLPISNIQMVNKLIQSGLEPAMVRPWQSSKEAIPEWQVGLRKTANHYEKSLHVINLDPWVHAGIMEVIKSIDSIINVYAGYTRENPKNMRSPI